MKRVQQGFTLIELMIVVAIVGILAAIALPAYQDFIVRSKMSEGVAALAACKTSAQDWISSHAGSTPTTSGMAGCSVNSTQFVNGGVVVANGGAPGTPVDLIVTTQNTGANAPCTLTLTSVQNAAFEVTSWTATHGGCLAKFVPSNFR
jgi:type IV pilus assembly protein PilA